MYHCTCTVFEIYFSHAPDWLLYVTKRHQHTLNSYVSVHKYVRIRRYAPDFRHENTQCWCIVLCTYICVHVHTYVGLRTHTTGRNLWCVNSPVRVFKLVKMTTRSQRDKEKKQQEEFQSILRRLLLEEDNKYCADCDAKGIFWVSNPVVA